MIRTCLEFMLSRFIDARKPAPPWLQRFLRRDVRLERFDTETRQLDAVLRSSAAQQRHAMTHDASGPLVTLPPEREIGSAASPSHPTRHSATWFVSICIAAVLLLALVPGWFRSTAPTVHAGEASQHLAAVPGKVLRMIHLATETSQSHLSQFSSMAEIASPQLPDWQELSHHFKSPVQQEIDLWQDHWQKLKSRWSSQPQDM